jgi:hypothetical protein
MPTIFLSYRRSDSDAITGHIAARLRASYGKKAIFLDVSSIPIASEFPAQIKSAIQRADVVIAVIGPAWHGPLDIGSSRIQQEDDFVRLEIELAVSAGAEVIPVLVGAAVMPSRQILPESLHFLCERHALRVTAGADFDHHMRRLIGAVDRALLAQTRCRTYSARAALCALGVGTVLLGSGLLGRAPHSALCASSAVAFGLVLAYAAIWRLLGIDLPRRLGIPLGVACAAILLAAFYIPPMLSPAPRAMPVSPAEVLASAAELQQEFAQARAAFKKNGSADFYGAQAIATSLSQFNNENGHALYYQAEIERVRAAARFGTDSCPKPVPAAEPADSLDIYRKGFYRYLEVEMRLPESETGGGPDWRLCYQRERGYCQQRTAWINHLLANDLYQEALAASDGDTRTAKLSRARLCRGSAEISSARPAARVYAMPGDQGSAQKNRSNSGVRSLSSPGKHSLRGHPPPPPWQMTLRRAWRFSTLTAWRARASAADSSAGSSTRSP